MTTASFDTISVTVYNSDGYTTLKPMCLSDALTKIALGKAVVHEIDDSKGFLRSAGNLGQNVVEWLWPKAIRLVKWVKLNYDKIFSPAMFTKGGVLRRDKYQCAYCTKNKATTIDHIQPKSRGGANDWMNTVAACFSCNNKKDNRTPKEAGMVLRFPPRIPLKAELMGI